jgi:hypothetical protein
LIGNVDERITFWVQVFEGFVTNTDRDCERVADVPSIFDVPSLLNRIERATIFEVT